MKRSLDTAVQVLVPAALVVAVGIGSTLVSSANEIYFLDALVSVAIVVSLYVFMGNSGVLSFGQISFVAVGAFAAGVMTIPLDSKSGVLPQLFPILRDHTIGNVASLLLAAAAGGVFALLVGLPLMRLSGLAAGIATFAVLEITHNVLREWTKIGPGATTLALVPETTRAQQATIGALVAIAVAFAYQRSRFGRMLRASREDAAAARGVGVSVHRERLLAFTVSGALGGFAGALLVHELGSITTEQVYLELTFLTLAMLVVGGVSSLWGAVLGALTVSGLSSFLSEAEQGVTRRRDSRSALGHAADHPRLDHGARADRPAVGPDRWSRIPSATVVEIWKGWPCTRGQQGRREDMTRRRIARALLAASLAAAALAAQPASAASGIGPLQPTVGTAAAFDTSPPLRTMQPIERPADFAQTVMPPRPQGPVGDERHDADGALQTTAAPTPPGPLSGPLFTFEGPSNTDNFNLFGFRVNPPDPVGDVGQHHYVAMVNLAFSIYSKTGTLLGGPFDTGTLWQGFPIEDCTDPSGDPIVVYDEISNRWYLTQFTTRAQPNPVDDRYYNCVAVSTTNDPLGSYYRYAFPTGELLPGLPEVRRHARRAVHHDAGVRADRG